MSNTLLARIAALLNIDEKDVDEDTNSESFEAWDSLREVDIAFMLEQAYGINIREDEIENLRSIREIRAILAKHGITDV